MDSLQDIIEEIQDEIRAVSGIRFAPDYPLEKMAGYPFAMCRAGDGEWRIGPPGTLHGMHNIVLEVHVARKQMEYDVKEANSFSRTIPAAIWGAFADNAKMTTVETMQRISYSFGRLDWIGIETVGYRFVLEGVKTQEAI